MLHQLMKTMFKIIFLISAIATKIIIADAYKKNKYEYKRKTRVDRKKL
jgi:hypothetical protein